MLREVWTVGSVDVRTHVVGEGGEMGRVVVGLLCASELMYSRECRGVENWMSAASGGERYEVRGEGMPRNGD